MIKTRFAPSPTGFLHIGGLRTALFAYLLAKKENGNFILRIEDTDKNRFVEGGMENILNSLKWTGLNIDEGVDLDKSNNIVQKGSLGPYIQSQRLEIYKKYIDELIEKGHAYYCFCDKKRLEELRKYQELNKKATGYDGHCRNISLEEVEKRIANGEKYVVRMKVPKENNTTFEDLVRGKVTFKNEIIDDQIILKEDGYPTYHLAVVVDDHLMKVSHIIRGEEWLSSTPKHILLYNMFSWDIPKFAHLPLLLNPDKSKLSKRQGDVAVEDYKEKGYLAEAILNFVAFLGWNPGDNREIFSLEELIKEFNFKKVNKSGAIFNIEKLNWYNGEYIKKLSLDKLVELSLVFFEKTDWWKKYKTEDKEKMGKIIALEQERSKTLLDIPEAVKFIFELPEYKKELIVWKKSDLETTNKILQELKEYLETILDEDYTQDKLQEFLVSWIKEKGYGNGDVLYPMRVVLSGQQNSPGPFEIAEVLGKDEVLNRIKKALKK